MFQLGDVNCQIKRRAVSEGDLLYAKPYIGFFVVLTESSQVYNQILSVTSQYLVNQVLQVVLMSQGYQGYQEAVLAAESPTLYAELKLTNY